MIKLLLTKLLPDRVMNEMGKLMLSTIAPSKGFSRRCNSESIITAYEPDDKSYIPFSFSILSWVLLKA